MAIFAPFPPWKPGDPRLVQQLLDHAPMTHGAGAGRIGGTLADDLDTRRSWLRRADEVCRAWGRPLCGPDGLARGIALGPTAADRADMLATGMAPQHGPGGAPPRAGYPPGPDRGEPTPRTSRVDRGSQGRRRRRDSGPRVGEVGPRRPTTSSSSGDNLLRVILVIGGLVVLVGGMFLGFLPVTAIDGAGGRYSCGSPWLPDSGGEQASTVAGAVGGGVIAPAGLAACADAFGSRSLLAAVVTGLGVLDLVGVGVMVMVQCDRREEADIDRLSGT